MFRKEAAWIADRLKTMGAADIGPIVNIGSSTDRFRTVQQPWIDEVLFNPLSKRDVRVVHLDLKEAEGVDLIADILSEEGFSAAKAVRPRTVLLCNVLEHVHDPARVAQRAFDLVEDGGRMFVSVPRSYPHHPDPFDTMFRPTPQEVAALVPQASLAEGEILPTGYHWQEVLRGERHLLRKRARWLFFPYKVTMAVLHKR